MDIKRENLSWQDAEEVIAAGGAVRIRNWRSAGGVGVAVLRLVGKKLVVCAGDGTPIHVWSPTGAELAYTDWQEITLDPPTEKTPAAAEEPHDPPLDGDP